ncbi:MAG: hypothetical protein M3445_10040, partial [Actinomycetota bacterium]|nr:hypothetical protein [Actinomycetota bacterium]
TEIRRCAIEHLGWDRYLTELGVRPVDECADPGNGDRTIALYDLPREAQLYSPPVRLLVMCNGSLDRGGTRRRYGETVPADMPDALTAAGWQYGCSRDEYAALTRRT